MNERRASQGYCDLSDALKRFIVANLDHGHSLEEIYQSIIVSANVRLFDALLDGGQSISQAFEQIRDIHRD